jgi:hypothetical protein
MFRSEFRPMEAQMLKIASIAMATLALLVGGTVVAAGLDASNGQPLRGEAAFGGWQHPLEIHVG